MGGAPLVKGKKEHAVPRQRPRRTLCSLHEQKQYRSQDIHISDWIVPHRASCIVVYVARRLGQLDSSGHSFIFIDRAP